MTPILRLILPVLALLLASGLDRVASAADMALVLTESTALDNAAAAHRSRVRAYREAGYDVTEGLDLTYEEMAALLTGVEGRLDDADRLVLHLTGRMAETGGVAVFLPRGIGDQTRTSVLTGGIPLALFLDMAAARPGQSLVALGRADAAGKPALDLDAPQGVMLLRGAPEPVSSVVTAVMVGAGLPATAIDAQAAGVRFEGLVTDQLRLGRNAGSGAAPTPRPEPQPEPSPTDSARAREDALGLTVAQRQQVQRDLTSLGFSTRGVDGIFGAGTRSAIRNWEKSDGRVVDGYLTRAEIRALSDDAAAARSAAAESERADREAWATAKVDDSLAGYRDYLNRYPEGLFVDEARARIDAIETADQEAENAARYQAQEQALNLNIGSLLLIETRLSLLGMNPGVIDGRIDKQTRAAIRRYQGQNGLTATGYLNGATVQRLVMGGN